MVRYQFERLICWNITVGQFGKGGLDVRLLSVSRRFSLSKLLGGFCVYRVRIFVLDGEIYILINPFIF